MLKLKQNSNFGASLLKIFFIFRGELNVAAIHCACSVLEGKHDFNYYMKETSKERRFINTIRTLHEVNLMILKFLKVD